MLRLFRRRERGQALMFVALCAPLLLGMTGMAVDIGSYAGHKRHLQNAADSIALAAAQDLCKVTCTDTSAAAASGAAWATKNNINPANVTLTFSGGNTAPAVRAVVRGDHKFAFMRVLGVNSKGVSAAASAVRASFGGNANIVPWSITQDTVDSVANGALVTLKYDTTGGSGTGNFGAIRIDGSGSSVYGDGVMYGSQDSACAVGTPNCTTGACPGATCAENSPTCDGPQCDPQTGNIVGDTRKGVDFRISNTSAACDTFAEVFSPLGTKYHLNADCNPWTDGPGKCANNNVGTLCSRRVIIIPVVDALGNGTSTSSTIQRFALVFLEGYAGGKCSGSTCDIQGRFVQADVTTGALAGAYDAKALIQFARLSE